MQFQDAGATPCLPPSEACVPVPVALSLKEGAHESKRTESYQGRSCHGEQGGQQQLLRRGAPGRLRALLGGGASGGLEKEARPQQHRVHEARKGFPSYGFHMALGTTLL